MTKQWQRDLRHDEFYKRAKSEGYRSRAVFKLKQINNRFKIFKKGDIVLDLGAAPGGWSEVALEFVGTNGLVIGVDLVRIKPLENVIFLVGDITDEGLVDVLKKKVNNKMVNILISDAAPNISGNYSIDQARSVYLASAALKIAEHLLIQNGNFIVKVFEGEDFNSFINQVKKRFRKYKIFSPKASRARSSETYIIGLGFNK